MTNKVLSERGSYRAIYETLYDDLDFQRLTPLAKLVWHVLKVKLKQYGIAVFYAETLPRLVGANAAAIEAALAELEKAKPNQALGWLVREEHVYWLVNAFRYDPNVGGGMTVNHQTGARRYAETLPKLHVVQQFLSYYGLEATAPKRPTIGRDSPTPPPSHTPTVGSNHSGVGVISESEPESERESESEPPPIPGLPPSALRFVARFYGNASEERRQEVIGQLRATLDSRSPGARISKGVHAKAVNSGHLERCCIAVINDPPDKDNAAIVWVLRKLTDPILNERGQTVTEAASDHTKAEIAKEERYVQAKRAAAKPWADAHPDELQELERSARIAIHGEGTFADISRKSWILERIAAKIEFPDFETWASGARETVTA